MPVVVDEVDRSDRALAAGRGQPGYVVIGGFCRGLKDREGTQDRETLRVLQTTSGHTLKYRLAAARP
jgi:hypothetical protein